MHIKNSKDLAEIVGKSHDRILGWVRNSNIPYGEGYHYTNLQNKRVYTLYTFTDQDFEYAVTQLLRRTTKGHTESVALQTIEQLLGIELVRQYRVGSYFVDGYDPNNNIVYEIDESQHFINGKLKPDCVRRQEWIQSQLGCEFKRIKFNTCSPRTTEHL